MSVVNTGRIALDKILYEEKHYPRVKPSTTQINKYVDDLRKGDIFPPIRILEGTNSLIDGYHRWKAHTQYRDSYEAFLGEGFDENIPEPTDDIACEWHTLPDGVMQLLYASSFQNKTGLGKSDADNKDAARRAYQAQEGISKSLLEEYIGVSRHKMSEYLSDLEAKHNETVHHMLLRWELLGWTQEEMADSLERAFPGSKGTSRRNIENVFGKNGTVDKIAKEFATAAHPVETLAKRHDMPLMLAWALKLAGKTDQERLAALDITLQPYDVLNFQGSDDRFGTEKYPGRIPGQLIAHILHWFTQPGDVVLDPMGGGGTTPDVCLAMGRKCYAYDINDSPRIDILPHDIAKESWPDRIKKADLVFWDPPYFDKKDDGYPDGSISRLDRKAYLAFFAKAFTEAKAQAKKGATLAFLMSDWNEKHDATTKREGIYLWHYADLLREAGWTLTEHIQVPLSTQQVHPDIVNKFRAAGRRARLERYLLIAKA